MTAEFWGSGFLDSKKKVCYCLKNLKVSRNTSFQSLYEGIINSLAVETVESKYLLCGTASGIVAIYDLTVFQGKHELSPVAHVGKSSPFCPGNVRTASWYPLHTGLFATSGEDGVLCLWDTNYMRPLDKYRIGAPIHNHAFGVLTSNLLAVASEQHVVRIVDYRTGSSSHILDAHESRSLSVSWSPNDERVLCSGWKDGRLLLWDVRMCKSPVTSLCKNPSSTQHAASKYQWRQRRAHAGPVIGLHFANDNLSLLSLGRDRVLRLWDIRTASWCSDLSNLDCNMMQSIHHVDIATSVIECSPPITLVPDGNSIRVVSLNSGETLSRLTGHFDQITSIIVVPDGTCRVVSAGYDQSILMWSYQPASTES